MSEKRQRTEEVVKKVAKKNSNMKWGVLGCWVLGGR